MNLNPAEMQDEALRRAMDRAELADLVQKWGFYRDDGRWPQLLGLYAPDGRMTTGAASGTAAQFIAFSQKLAAESQVRAQHFIGASNFEIRASKAIGETRAMVLLRGPVHGIEVDVTVYARMIDRFVRHQGRWAIQERSPIYEKDRLDPVDPAATLRLDQDALGQYPQGYRHMAYLNNAAGVAPTASDLPTAGSPGAEALYARTEAWLAED
jgi:hypothetical protein